MKNQDFGFFPPISSFFTDPMEVRDSECRLYFEKNWLQNCPSDFKPHYYMQFIGIFVLFNSPEHLEAF